MTVSSPIKRVTVHLELSHCGIAGTMARLIRCTRYHGVFAPHHAWRKEVVPKKPDTPSSDIPHVLRSVRDELVDDGRLRRRNHQTCSKDRRFFRSRQNGALELKLGDEYVDPD